MPTHRLTIQTLACLGNQGTTMGVDKPWWRVIVAHTAASTAFWGENMTLSALDRGVVAAVIVGGCRDVRKIRRLRFPVVCRRIVPNVAAIAGYGEVNVTVQCSGVAVSPGGIVVGEENGVVLVPMAQCEAILERTGQLLEAEHVLQDQLRAGGTIGQLIDVDAVFASTFSYQQRALKGGQVHEAHIKRG